MVYTPSYKNGKIGDGGSYRFTHITQAYTSHVFRAVRSHQALRTSNAGKERDSLSCHSLFVGSKMTSNVAYGSSKFCLLLLSHHQWHFLIFQRMRKAFSRKSIWCCNMHQTAIRSFWIIFCSLVNGHQNDISLAAIPHFLWITIYNDVAMWGHSRHPSFAALSPHLAPAITVRKIMLYNCYPNIQWIWFYDILWSYPYQYHINIINNTRKPWPIMVHISLDQTLTAPLHRCTETSVKMWASMLGTRLERCQFDLEKCTNVQHRPTMPNYSLQGRQGYSQLRLSRCWFKNSGFPGWWLLNYGPTCSPEALEGKYGRRFSRIVRSLILWCQAPAACDTSVGHQQKPHWHKPRAVTQWLQCLMTPMSDDSNV